MFIVLTTYGHYASSYSGAAGRRSLGRETERRRGRGEKSKLESSPSGQLRIFFISNHNDYRPELTTAQPGWGAYEQIWLQRHSRVPGEHWSTI